MKENQKLWSTFFLFAPAIIVGVNFGFLQGIVAFILNFVFGVILSFSLLKLIPINFMLLWAYIKGPLIGVIIVSLFIFYNK